MIVVIFGGNLLGTGLGSAENGFVSSHWGEHSGSIGSLLRKNVSLGQRGKGLVIGL